MPAILMATCFCDGDAVAPAFFSRDNMFIDITRAGLGVYDITLAVGFNTQEYGADWFFKPTIVQPLGAPDATFATVVRLSPTAIRVNLFEGLAAVDFDFMVTAKRIATP